jgi:nitroreductase
METLEAIALRKSIRKYLPKKVSWEDITKLILAGRDAPSSGNLQNWRFIIIDDEEVIEQLSEVVKGQRWISDAPLIIAVCCDIETAKIHYGLRGERLYAIQNCAAAIENMLIAATDVGLGSCWLGDFNEIEVAGILGVPLDRFRVQALLTFGYPAENPKPEPRQEVYTITFLNGFNSRIRNLDHILGYHSEKVRSTINLVSKGTKKGAHALAKHTKKIFEHGKKHIDLLKERLNRRR